MAKHTNRKIPTTKKAPGLLDFNKVKIHNLLDGMERTFLQVGTKIGKYKVIEEVDRGGMAVVYKATQLDLDRTVALKVLPANVTINRQFVERFLSEAHAVAQLTHPNIVSIYEVSMENNIYFLAMEYIPGRNLFHYLNIKKPKLVEVLEIFVQITDALAYAHEQRIIHRDLKLNNVIMRDNRSPILIDFGLAKALEDDGATNITKTGEIMGSPAYMAPERILGGESDSRSDICSLGIMLYELLTFKNPYLDPRSLHQTTSNVIEATPIPPRKLVPWLPGEVEAITLKAMHKYPENRYQSMSEFREDIMRYQRGEHVLANPPSLSSRVFHFVRKRWPYVAIAATVLVFSALFLLSMYIQNRKEGWRWKQVLFERFDTEESIGQWIQGTALIDSVAAGWQVRDGALRIASDRYTYIRLDRAFTRDMRFEFDVTAHDGDVFETGFFICGREPEDGYRFIVHRGPLAQNGIVFPGSHFLFFEYDRAALVASSEYHVTVQKLDHVITFSLNGIQIAEVRDHFPPLGKQHQYVGFFVSRGTYAFDNLKLYRRTVPMLASPAIVADRFWQHGEFDAALSEYRELLLDISSKRMSTDVRLRMSDCLIRLGRYDLAGTFLREPRCIRNKDEDIRAHATFLLGIGELLEKGASEDNDNFLTLAQRYPTSPFNESVHSRLLLEAGEELRNDTIQAAEDALIMLAKRYPKLAGRTGRMHVQLLGRLMEYGLLDRVLSMNRRIEKLYRGNPLVESLSRFITARALLGKRDKYGAIDLLNQCVASQVTTRGVWQAWLTLGEIYEFDHNYADALAAYGKVAQDCPKGSPLAWMAKLKIGELRLLIGKEDNSEAVFREVTQSNHPFPIPRAIARYYLDSLTLNQLRELWYSVEGLDESYLLYAARKAVARGERTKSLEILDQLLAMLSPDSWEYVKIYSFRNDIETGKEGKAEE